MQNTSDLIPSVPILLLCSLSRSLAPLQSSRSRSLSRQEISFLRRYSLKRPYPLKKECPQPTDTLTTQIVRKSVSFSHFGFVSILSNLYLMKREEESGPCGALSAAHLDPRHKPARSRQLYNFRSSFSRQGCTSQDVWRI